MSQPLRDAEQTPDWSPHFGPADARRPKTLQVYEAVRRAIIGMHLPPGAVVPEKEICRLMMISRTPVREALLKLASENLVAIKPADGTFVTPIILSEVLDGQIVRDTLEMRCLRLAARNFEDRVASEFEVLLFQQQGAAARRDADTFFELDNRFHKLICDCSGFGNAWATIHGATGQLDRVRRHAFGIENNYGEVLQEHSMMFESIKSRDADGAASVFQIQLDSIFHTLALIQDVQPGLITPGRTTSVADIR